MQRFTKLLLIIGLVALAGRVGYALIAPHGTDEDFFTAQANVLARGDGFTDFRDGLEIAERPPLTTLVLVPGSWIGGGLDSASPADLRQRNQLEHRLTMSVLGAAVVVLIGLLGRRVAGERVGLLAAGIAAVYPNLWANDGLAVSETLEALMVAVAILVAYRFLRTPSWANVLWLGSACGATMLVRANLGLLLPVMVLPLVLRLGSPLRRRLVLSFGAFAAAAIVVAPWTIANALRFEELVLFSTNDGLTLCGANSPNSYFGREIGMWSADCAFALPPRDGDWSVRSNILRDRAFEYIGDHLDRVPLVVAVRIGRVWNLYGPVEMAEAAFFEGRSELVSWMGFATFWLLVPLAAAGALSLRRRKVELWPLLAQVVVVTVSAAAVYGIARFRVPAEIPFVVLAAVGIDAIARRRSKPPMAALHPTETSVTTGKSHK